MTYIFCLVIMEPCILALDGTLTQDFFKLLHFPYFIFLLMIWRIKHNLHELSNQWDLRTYLVLCSTKSKHIIKWSITLLAKESWNITQCGSYSQLHLETCWDMLNLVSNYNLTIITNIVKLKLSIKLNLEGSITY